MYDILALTIPFFAAILLGSLASLKDGFLGQMAGFYRAMCFSWFYRLLCLWQSPRGL